MRRYSARSLFPRVRLVILLEVWIVRLGNQGLRRRLLDCLLLDHLLRGILHGSYWGSCHRGSRDLMRGLEHWQSRNCRGRSHWSWELGWLSLWVGPGRLHMSRGLGLGLWDLIYRGHAVGT